MEAEPISKTLREFIELIAQKAKTEPGDAARKKTVVQAEVVTQLKASEKLS